MGVRSQPDIVKMLIDAGVPLNPRSKNLSTPLIFACWQVLAFLRDRTLHRQPPP